MVLIVVARYNENVEWTKRFPNVIICNKGEMLGNDYREIFYDNVGREGHTYYKFIYDNYDNLEDYIIFLQGNPFDHSPNLYKNIDKYLNQGNLKFEYLSEHILDCDFTGRLAFSYTHPLKEVYEKLFDVRKEHLEFIFGSGAQFIVSREQILKRPREFYLKIVKLLEYSVNPIEGHVIERFHKLILGDS